MVVEFHQAYETESCRKGSIVGYSDIKSKIVLKTLRGFPFSQTVILFFMPSVTHWHLILMIPLVIH